MFSERAFCAENLPSGRVRFISHFRLPIEARRQSLYFNRQWAIGIENAAPSLTVGFPHPPTH